MKREIRISLETQPKENESYEDYTIISRVHELDCQAKIMFQSSFTDEEQKSLLPGREDKKVRSPNTFKHNVKIFDI